MGELNTTKLNRILDGLGGNSKAIKNNLESSRLDEIVTITEEGGGGSKLNVFMQETEPDTKEGIWLQSDNLYENIVSDSDIGTPGKTVLNKYGSLEKTPTKVIYHKNEVYIFVTKALYKYSVENNKLTLLKEDIGFSSSSYDIACYMKGYVYFLSTTASYKFNMDTYEYEIITNLSTANHSFACTDNAIYTFGGWSNDGRVLQKYDIETNTVTNPCSIVSNYYSDGEIIGDILYIFGNDEGLSSAPSNAKRVIEVNLKTNTYTSKSVLPFYFDGGKTVKVNTDIYLIGGKFESGSTINNKSFYKYDTITGTVENMGNLPTTGQGISSVIIDNKGQILIFVSKNLITVETQSKVYDDKTVVIQVKPLANTYETKLIGEQNVSFCFMDTFYYSAENGLDRTIPTYYGDGTEWIKFKN